jgi:hypothetical protein
MTLARALSLANGDQVKGRLKNTPASKKQKNYHPKIKKILKPCCHNESIGFNFFIS